MLTRFIGSQCNNVIGNELNSYLTLYEPPLSKEELLIENHNNKVQEEAEKIKKKKLLNDKTEREIQLENKLFYENEDVNNKDATEFINICKNNYDKGYIDKNTYEEKKKQILESFTIRKKRKYKNIKNCLKKQKN